jgi:hypothetical protein
MSRSNRANDASRPTDGCGKRGFLQCVVAAALLCGWGVSGSRASGQIQLREVAGSAGIDFRHTDGSCGRHYIVETVSAGLALFDYDGDGDVDAYFLNGSPLPGTNAKAIPRNALYRNDGNWKFTDVTLESGVGDTGYGLGVAVGDYDNDGDPDLYLNNYGPNVLYRNNGDGTFADVSREAGVSNGDKMGAGACFFDMDGDGDLDLYAANYLQFSYEDHVLRTSNGVPIYFSPAAYDPVPDTLYRNDADGTFTDVSTDSGVATLAGWGMGTVCGDFDNDGDTDVFIANDVAENFLFQNDGTGNFQEMGLMAGVAVDHAGNSHGSMGVECADYNNDGRLDLYVTSYQVQFATLFANLGDHLFRDATQSTGAGTGTYAFVTWGAGLVDFDNDGDRDVFVACGHLQDNIERYDDTTSYHTRNRLLMNTGEGKFVDVSDQSGDGLKVKLSSRGAAFDDLDNDGDIDVVVLNSRHEPTILRNDSANNHHWIQIRLRGTKTNRGGVGARVEVVSDDLTQIDEVHSGRGYQSHYGTRLHFGLGKGDRVDRIEVRWIGGGTDVLENVDADQLVTITEGSSEIERQ